MAGAVRGRWGGRAGAEAVGTFGAATCPGGRADAHGGHDAAHRAPGVWDAPPPRRPRALRGPWGQRDDDPTHPARGGASRRASAAGAGAGASAAALRARRAEPAVAVGHLHLSAAAPRARVRGSLHGRPLALPRVARARAPPAVVAGHGGAGTRHRGLRHAARDPHGPRAAVHGVAGRDGIRGGAPAPGHPAREVPAAAPADARQSGAVLEDAVGRISLADGLRGLCRLHAASRAVRAGVQLSAAAPGGRGAGAGGPFLPLGAARAGGGGARGGGQRSASGAPAAGA